MITAKDIRSGNILLFDLLETKLDWDELRLAESDPSAFNAVYKPLPITPELLERALHSYYEKYKPVNWRITGPNYVINTKYMEIIILDPDVGDCIMIGDSRCKLKGFHHLQNIIYDLTGIELTL